MRASRRDRFLSDLVVYEEGTNLITLLPSFCNMEEMRRIFLQSISVVTKIPIHENETHKYLENEYVFDLRIWKI